MRNRDKNTLVHVLGAFGFLLVAAALVCALVLTGVVKGNGLLWEQETFRTTTTTIVIYP